MIPTLADDILNADDRPLRPVTAWGRKLFLRPMSGLERDAFDREQFEAQKAGAHLVNWRARYLVRCLVDHQGNRIFTDEQAEALGAKNGEVLYRLHELASEINKDGPGAVEAEAKNS